MGTATANFYNDAYSRQGWADVAAQVRERWQAGDRDGAAGLVTDEMVLATTLIGTEDMVRARLQDLARHRRGYGAPLPGRRHPRRPPGQPRPGHQPGPGGRPLIIPNGCTACPGANPAAARR